MHALVSILPQPFYNKVEDLWDVLENNFGLRGIRPFPHFSWQVSDTYKIELISKLLDEISNTISPFEISVRGIDVFVSKTPVVFLKIIKDNTLIKNHFRIWKKIFQLAKAPNLLYSPPLWRPHITLTYQDLPMQRLREVMGFLRKEDINWTFMINNLTMVCQEGDQPGKIGAQVTLKPDSES